MVLSALAQASKMRRVWGWGTASSALCSIANIGTDMCAADFSPWALVSSGDHCDNQERRVEKRAEPTGPVLTVSGWPMKQVPIGRSLGSMLASRNRGSAMVRWVTKPRSISSPPRLRKSASVSFTQAVRLRKRASCAAR